MQDLHQCIVTKAAFANRQLLQKSCEGGHRRLEMSSFLSWEDAAKVSCPFSTVSMYPSGLAWCVVSVQMWTSSGNSQALVNRDALPV